MKKTTISLNSFCTPSMCLASFFFFFFFLLIVSTSFYIENELICKIWSGCNFSTSYYLSTNLLLVILETLMLLTTIWHYMNFVPAWILDKYFLNASLMQFIRRTRTFFPILQLFNCEHFRFIICEGEWHIHIIRSVLAIFWVPETSDPILSFPNTGSKFLYNFFNNHPDPQQMSNV